VFLLLANEQLLALLLLHYPYCYSVREENSNKLPAMSVLGQTSLSRKKPRNCNNYVYCAELSVIGLTTLLNLHNWIVVGHVNLALKYTTVLWEVYMPLDGFP